MIPDAYLPRTNYVPACDSVKYAARMPNIVWDKELKPNMVTSYYRGISRTMLSQSGERTLITSIMPVKAGHIDGGFSITFKKQVHIPEITASFASLPYDFFIKATGKGHFRNELAKALPVFENHIAMSLMILRGLSLNCLTTHYADLWHECWNEAFMQERWAKNDPRLDNNKFANLTPKWQRNCALRTDYERRQALVEIDVLAAMALGLTLEELCTIYRIQFPVLRQNENDTWYNQNGRIVFTCSKGLPGVGFSRPEWNDINDMQSGTVSRTIMDDTMPGGPKERTITYIAPFDKCDREKDYATVWPEFEKRMKK